jgi:DNA polymerase-3 subunit delta
VYYLYGKDVVSVESLVKVAVESIVPNGDDFNVYRLDGKSLNMNEFVDVAESCPMFADYKCITIHDFNCETISADELRVLLSTLDSLPSTTIVVFYVTGFDVKNGKKSPTAKNKKLIDYVAKHGVVFEAVQKTLPQTAKEIQEVCRQHGCEISYDNAQLVANKCLCDSLTIRSEVKKLVDYANGREVTLQMVNDLVSNYYDVNAFDFSKAIVSMNGQLALKLLNELYTLNAEPIAVLSAVTVAFVDLYRVKTALATNRNESDILADFNYRGREFVVRNYIRDARRVRLEHVRECINILKSTNLALLSSSVDGKTLLEQAVAKMINAGFKYR